MLATMPTSSSFFCCSRPRRDLHSFPTRRSSDLSTPTSMSPSESWAGFVTSRAVRISPAQVPKMGRSEEHTSELQSHSDLVCRLLLEKKNYRSRSHLTSRLKSRTAALLHPHAGLA